MSGCRMKEEEKATQGIQEEWEVELTKITAKFERDLQGFFKTKKHKMFKLFFI